jgi:hypothetical protein
MNKGKARYKSIVVFICTSIIVVFVLWLIYFPPLRYWSYKHGLIGDSNLQDLIISMKDKWYPSFGTEFGSGWLIYLFKKDTRDDPFTNEPYVVFSKLDNSSISHEIQFSKVHIDEANDSNYSKNFDYSVNFPWGTAHVFKRSNPDHNYFVLIKELKLNIITPDISLLNEIENIRTNEKE